MTTATTDPTVTSSPVEGVPCDLCGSTSFDVVYDSMPGAGGEGVDLKTRFAASSGVYGDEQVVRCKQCSLVYVSPRFKEEHILMGYKEADNSLYISQEEGRLQTFRSALRKIAPYVSKKGKVLDVGCAAGYFLQAAKEAGWETTGIEVSQELVDFSKSHFGLNVMQGNLVSATLPLESFDMITLWDVLEHTYQPMNDLKKAYALLKPGGLLVVNYPDFGSVWAKWLKRRWWFLISVHLTYFTIDTVTKMAEKAGFKPLNHWMHFQKLEFGYLIYRLEAYAKGPAKFFGKLASALKMDKLLFPYYASQTTFLARKPLA